MATDKTRSACTGCPVTQLLTQEKPQFHLQLFLDQGKINCEMSLKDLVHDNLMKDVIRDTKVVGKKLDWKVLIGDSYSIRILDFCFKMGELSTEGVVDTVNIEKNRLPMPEREAIYLIQPSSVKHLLEDFSSPTRPMYKFAHVYFTEPCPDERFDDLTNSQIVKRIKTLKEINISFIPYEPIVYSLDDRDLFQRYYSPSRSGERQFGMEKMSTQVATMCAALGEYPRVRYRADCDDNLKLAFKVQQKLDAYKELEPGLGDTTEKAKSQLIILDRGFDVVSPLVHELTYQAMVMDLLQVHDDKFIYEDKEGRNREATLRNDDSFWVSNRHQHLSRVLPKVKEKLEELGKTEQKLKTEDEAKGKMREMKQVMQNLPQHQKLKSEVSTHLQITEELMKKLEKYLVKYDICALEQDLAMGTDIEGRRVHDNIKNNMIGSFLLNTNVEENDKIRMIVLYILSKNGVTEDFLSNLINTAKISKQKTAMIRNIASLGINVIENDGNVGQVQRRKEIKEMIEDAIESKLGINMFGDNDEDQVARKDRYEESASNMSRWTPVLKDLVEDAIDNKLDENQFPFIRDNSDRSTYKSARYGGWGKDKKDPKIANANSRILVFVIGGLSYNEMRVAYEITTERKNWEVVMGGTHISQPETFLDDIKNLDKDLNEDDEIVEDENKAETIKLLQIEA